MARKHSTGYEKKPKEKKIKREKKHYVSSLLVSNPKKVSVNEKIVKFLIYIALRLVIRPSKWKDSDKNYEIIDRTYKRIMSADFIFIPSSIAFYLIMAFLPVLSIVLFLYQFEFMQNLLSEGHRYWISESGQIYIDPSKLPIGEAFSEPLWQIDNNSLEAVVGKFIPGMSSIISQISHLTNKGQHHIIDVGATTATIISLIISTWIAAGGFSKLVFTQSYIFEHKYVGGYWMNKLKGMFIVALFTLALIFALVINISIQKWIHTTDLSNAAKDGWTEFLLVVSLAVGSFFLFVTLYKFSPRFSINVRHVIPGAMVTTVPTILFLSLFGYISSLWTYGDYGMIGVIMYLGMASLIVTYFIFVGIITNASYYKTFIGNKVKTKWTLSKK